jgi:hypothetical protein
MRLSAGITVALSLLVLCVHAQRTQYGRIKGTVIDSSERRPLEAATVSVFLVADSSLVAYALTQKNGEFTVSNIPRETRCWLMVSYNGYNGAIRNFVIPKENQELQLKDILIDKAFRELDQVTVVAQKPPVVVRQDTVEFNVGSFQTRPNAMIEDALKQMPGVEIDAEGNIMINGKPVSKITLDGKEFFGGDPKIAIKNLPKDIIDKIQVTEYKSREDRFNRTASTGNEDLTINLTIHKDKNKGLFGMVGAGYGTDDRHELFATLNYFNKDRQISLISNANNTNRSGQSSGDFNISSGRGTLGGGGGDGIATNKSAGINFSDNASKAWRINGSYFFNRGDMKNNTRLQRQNILPDTTFFYNAQNNVSNNNEHHRVNFNAQFAPDTLTQMHVNAGFDANRNISVTGNEAVSTGEQGKLINNSVNTFVSASRDHRVHGEFFVGRRFHKRGRGLSLGINFNYSDQPGQEENKGFNEFFKEDTLDSREEVDQRSVSLTTGKSIAISASYTEPLWEDLTLHFRHSYSRNTNNSDKETHRFNPLTGEYDIEDAAFTNAFRNTTTSHSPGFSLQYAKDKWRWSVGTALQFLTQDNVSLTDDSLLHQYFVNFTPTASVGYNFSKTFHLNLYYNGRSQQPSIQQLQPLPDNRNPLYVRLGNPDLQPAFYHNLHLNVRYSNGNSFWHTAVSVNSTMRQITYETFFDEFGRQVSRPINVNGNYNFSWNLHYSKSWKRRNWSLRLNLGNRGSYNRSVTFTNKTANRSDAYSISPTIGFNFSYKQILSLQPNWNIRYNITRYTVSTVQDATYNTSRLGVTMLWNYPRRLIIENHLHYNYNSRIAPGFRKGVTMWSAAVNYQLFSKQQATVRLAIYDILRQNLGVRRNISEIYIEDRQTQVLQQYFLLSFIYNLRKF